MTERAYSLHSFEDPRALVAIGGEGDRTLADLQADVARVASRLPAAGDVLLACGDRYRFVAALLACLRRGCHAVLAHSPQNAALIEMAQARGAVACLHDGGADGLDVRVLLATPLPLAAAEPIAAIGGERHFVTLSTSGSTGTPAFFDKSARQLLGEAQTLAQMFGAECTRCVLSTVPPRHIYGLLFGVLWPWQLGLPFVRDTPLLPEAVIDAARRSGADTLIAVPPHLAALASATDLDRTALARVFSSGAPLASVSFRVLTDTYGWVTTEVLGSTETGGFAYRRRAEANFTPFPGMRLEVDSTGVLILHSPFLESDAPFQTRDRIELAPDGSFAHRGRSDDIVKIGGSRVSLAAIEERARALPGVRDAAGLSVDVGGARGVEVWLVVEGEGWDGPRLRSALAEKLDPLALPRRYRVVDRLPRDAAGKLPKANLHALFVAPQPRAAEERSFEFARLSGGDPAAVQFSVRVPPDLAHCEGDPILPGVVQLHALVVERAQEVWPDLRAPREVKRLKVTRPIQPNDTLQLSLRRPGEGPRVDFQIVAGSEACASGTVLFATEGARA